MLKSRFSSQPRFRLVRVARGQSRCHVERFIAEPDHHLPPDLSDPDSIVIATRASELALWQARFVQDQIKNLYPRLNVSLMPMTTQGDRQLQTPLSAIGGKGLFVKELEEAMTAGTADIAVHSMKDVPMDLPPGFAMAAIMQREDARDAFISNRYQNLGELPAGGCVGTSSLRRASQVRARHPSLMVEPLRGNVLTRLRKLDDGQYAAIILAAAGLARLGLGARIGSLLSIEESLPAVGQGALGIECLAERNDLVTLVQPLNHLPSSLCVRAERAMSRALAGNCQVPLGAYAVLHEDRIAMSGFVASPDGGKLLRADSEGAASDPETVGADLARCLRAQGADAILSLCDALSH
ncbi:MAG: hydroxymethylbilane synthase [Pseudomonadota bacterium]|nr:hydroxymethylbilane synthase [Burkholderiales bacterium]MDQ3196107.1 hydroxymethylbilane synthase [Pseudomonadota bacterium]